MAFHNIPRLSTSSLQHSLRGWVTFSGIVVGSGVVDPIVVDVDVVVVDSVVVDEVVVDGVVVEVLKVAHLFVVASVEDGEVVVKICVVLCCPGLCL